MYQKCDDPWNIGKADKIQYDIMLSLIHHYCDEVIEKGVLDLGCGKGAFTKRLSDLINAPIVATDISSTAIKFAKERNYSKNIHYLSLDVCKEFDLISGKFGLIIFSQIIWCILEDFLNVFNAIIEKKLVPGGYILINQAFYPPGIQMYGTGYFSNVEELIRYLDINPKIRVDIYQDDAPNVLLLIQGVK